MTLVLQEKRRDLPIFDPLYVVLVKKLLIVDFVSETLKNCHSDLHGINKMRHYKVNMAFDLWQKMQQCA